MIRTKSADDKGEKIFQVERTGGKKVLSPGKLFQRERSDGWRMTLGELWDEVGKKCLEL
jgi:hypothetical protein